MKSRFARRPKLSDRATRIRRSPAPAPARVDLDWVHDGVRYRATVGPDVTFTREIAPGRWGKREISEHVFASAALGVTGNEWRRYLEFLPAPQRRFVAMFQFGRMAALHVITRCPSLLPDLTEVPALVAFLATHLSLRGGSRPAWSEIAAVYDREGLFGVLQWLGLPASRQAIVVLQNIADPDIPRSLLEPLRAAMWDPEAMWALSHAASLTDERLAEACHALAA